MDCRDMKLLETFSIFWGLMFSVASFNGESEPVVTYIATAFLAFGVTTHLLLTARGGE